MSIKSNLFLLFVLFSIQSFSQCVINDLSVTRSACNLDEKFSVEIDFNFDGVGDSGFRIQGNGANYGEFKYADLPIVIENLAGNCTTEWEFVIRDIDTPTCAADFGLGVVCCNLDCEYDIVDFELGECLNGGYSILFDLEYANTLELGLDVFVNGNLENSYPYSDLPIFLEDLVPLNDRDNVLVVCDQGNNMCCDTITFESPCACSIKNVRSRIVECSDIDSTYYLKIDFDTNMVSDSFQVGGNGTFFGTYAYTDLPLAVGPANFHLDTAYYLVVDQRNSFCFEEIIVAPVDTCDFNCGISNAEIQVGDCDNDENFYVTLTFEYENTGLQGFTVQGNGVVYGEDFQYGMESYKIGPLKGDCETLYEFIIKDNELGDCKTEAVLLEPICCKSCNINELVVEPVCDGAKVTQLFIDFNYEFSLDSMFIVKVNDIEFGPFHFKDIPLSLDVDLPGAEQIRVEVQDQNDPDCKRVKELLPDCGEVPCGKYVNVLTEYSECSENNTYFLDIDFELEGEHSDSFYISIQDKLFGPFAHGETFYRIGPLESNCKRLIFKFVDVDRPDCTQFHEIDEIKCCESCMIEGANIETKCEDGEMVGFFINVKGNDKTTKYSFEFEDMIFGPFAYDESHFIELSIPNGNYTFKAIDVEFPDCFALLELKVDCGDILPCAFENVEIETVNCEEETFEFLIDFSLNQNPSFLFDLTINGMYQGTSSYSLLPITSTTLNRNDGGPWKILIKDRQRECVLEIEIEEELCEVNLSDPSFDFIKVNNNGSFVWATSTELGETYNYMIVNNLGQVIIKNQWLSTTELSIDLGGISSGIYFLLIEKEGMVNTYKVSKF